VSQSAQSREIRVPFSQSHKDKIRSTMAPTSSNRRRLHSTLVIVTIFLCLATTLQGFQVSRVTVTKPASCRVSTAVNIASSSSTTRRIQDTQANPFLLLHELDSHSSVDLPYPHRLEDNPWRELIPPLWNTRSSSGSSEGVDVTIEWSIHDDPDKVARDMIRQSTASTTVTTPSQQQIQHLSQSLFYFRELCADKLTPISRFKARLVATRGPTGTKCPQWHIDHVPVRWIQSLVGRGCEFVESNDGVNWQAVNGLDEDETLLDSVAARNRALVDPQTATIRRATEGRAVLLIGNRWQEYSKDASSKYIQPAVHKSPAPIPLWEGRVLLTQDVILDHDV
jgi:hypothetical protein